jgi:hypothetical protein
MVPIACSVASSSSLSSNLTEPSSPGFVYVQNPNSGICSPWTYRTASSPLSSATTTELWHSGNSTPDSTGRSTCPIRAPHLTTTALLGVFTRRISIRDDERRHTTHAEGNTPGVETQIAQPRLFPLPTPFRAQYIPVDFALVFDTIPQEIQVAGTVQASRVPCCRTAPLSRWLREQKHAKNSEAEAKPALNAYFEVMRGMRDRQLTKEAKQQG